MFDANGLAVRAAHHEAAAYGGAVFVNAAIHAAAIHRHAPSVVSMRHHAMALRQLRGKVRGYVVFRFQDNHQATAHRIANGAMCLALRVPTEGGHVRAAIEMASMLPKGVR